MPWKDRLSKKWYKKWWLWTVLLLIIISIGYFVSPDLDAPLSVQSEPVMDTSATTVPADTVDAEELQDSLRRAEEYQDSLRRAEAYLDSLREVRVQDSLEAVREEQAKVAEIEAAERKKAEERARKEKQAEEKARRDAARQDSLRRAEAYQDSLEAARATTGVHNGHEWVDLGLSVLWATCNVGASSPSDYGGYYLYGETTEMSDYTLDKGGFIIEKATNKLNISGNSKYDAATALWGKGWRIPTRAEFEELCDECEWKWINMNGRQGYKVTGPNGGSIFLPASGDCGWMQSPEMGIVGEIADCEKYGRYLSSSLDKYYRNKVNVLYFFSTFISVDAIYRFGAGRSIRPVLDR